MASCSPPPTPRTLIPNGAIAGFIPNLATASLETVLKNAPLSTMKVASCPLTLTLMVGCRPTIVTGTSASWANSQAAEARPATAAMNMAEATRTTDLPIMRITPI